MSDSTVIDPIAQALAALAETITVNSETLKGVWPPQKGLPSVPCVEFEIPRVTWVDVDQAQTQLGADDWTFDFPAVIWFDLRQAEAAQQRLVAALEQWRVAVGTTNLDGLCQEAAVTAAEPVYDVTDAARPLIGYETTVRVWALVTTS